MKIKKMLLIVLIILLLLALVTFSIIICVQKYKSQPHIVLSKKMYVPIDENIDIIYFNDEGGNEAPLCYAGLTVSDEQYSIILNNMKNSGYTKVNSEVAFLRGQESWVPVDKVSETYMCIKVERNRIGFSRVQGRRVRVCVYVTDSKNGYRNMYFFNNCSMKKDGTVIN